MRKPFPKKWQCLSCNEILSRARPHQHPNDLQRLCSLEECERPIPKGRQRTCSEAHALQIARRVDGLPEAPPIEPQTGQWLFHHRQRLRVDRVHVSHWLGRAGFAGHATTLWNLEVRNLKLPSEWAEVLNIIGSASAPEVVDAVVGNLWPRKANAAALPQSPARQPDLACDISLHVLSDYFSPTDFQLSVELRRDNTTKISVTCSPSFLLMRGLKDRPTGVLPSVIEDVEALIGRQRAGLSSRYAPVKTGI